MTARIIIGVIIVLLACPASIYAQSPEEAVRAYWDAMIRDDYEAAWEVLCEKQKKVVRQEDFVSRRPSPRARRLNRITAIEI